jgi:hypothetical protein
MKLARQLCLAVACLLITATLARSEVILTGYYGSAFSGTMPSSQPTYGGAIGFLAGGWFGAETEYGYVKDFFGSTNANIGLTHNKVQSFSGNMLLGVPLGPVRPYAAAGLSLLGANLTGAASGAGLDSTTGGYNVGGGLFIWLGGHFGLRGDYRYFHTFGEVGNGASVGVGKLDFSRAIGGLTLKF